MEKEVIQLLLLFAVVCWEYFLRIKFFGIRKASKGLILEIPIGLAALIGTLGPHVVLSISLCIRFTLACLNLAIYKNAKWVNVFYFKSVLDIPKTLIDHNYSILVIVQAENKYFLIASTINISQLIIRIGAQRMRGDMIFGGIWHQFTLPKARYGSFSFVHELERMGIFCTERNKLE